MTRLFRIVLVLACAAPCLVHAQDNSAGNQQGGDPKLVSRAKPADQPAAPTPIAVMVGSENSIQLSVTAPEGAVYPFTFTAKNLPDPLKLSATGMITGNPTTEATQTVEIDVTDLEGTQIAQYNVLLKIGKAGYVVRLGNTAKAAAGSGPGAQPNQQANPGNANAQVWVNPALYEGADQLEVKGDSSKPFTVTVDKTPYTLLAPAGQKTNSGSADQTDKDKKGAATTPADQKKVANKPAPDASASAQKPEGGGPHADSGTSQDVQPGSNGNDAASAPSAAPAPAAANATAGTSSSKQANTSASISLSLPASLKTNTAVKVQQGNLASQATVLPSPKFNGEQTRVIVGYQQAGASSADFDQNAFFDMYASRPLPLRNYDDNSDVPTRVWGNVRVASFPQTDISAMSVTQAATNFATSLGNIKLNQLAMGAEFLVGLDHRLFKTSFPFIGASENTRQRLVFSAIAAVGATGFFTAPDNSVHIFKVPAANDPHAADFNRIFPNVTSQYIGITAPNLQRFPKQYLGGLRITTQYADAHTAMPLKSAPAMVTVSLGQNQLITDDRFHGVVGRVEAFYPLPIGDRTSRFSGIYLFGSAQMAFHKQGRSDLTPLILSPADASVHAFDNNVTVRPVVNTRDLYHIGVGIDLVDLITKIKGAAQAPPANPPANPPAAANAAHNP